MGSRLQNGKISALDSETVGGYAKIISTEYRSWEPYSFEDCVRPILHDIKNQNISSRIVMWNQGYDGRAIVKYLPKENIAELITDNETVYDGRYDITFIQGKVLKIRDLKLKATISGYDIAQFFNYMRLEDAGLKYVGQGKYESEITKEITTRAQQHTDNELYWIFAHNLDELKHYCMEDAKLTQKLGYYMANTIQEMYGFKLSSYASKTGIGKRLIKDTIGTVESNGERFAPYPMFYEDSEAGKFAMASYHGGIFDCNKRGTFEEVTDIDISCFSDDTEILTIDGYKKYTEINIGDKVATLNINNGNIEYQPIQHIHIHEYDGELIHVANKKVDILATPNHRIYYQFYHRNKKVDKEKYKSWSEFQIRELKDIPKNYIRIPTGGDYVDGKKEYTNDEIKLFGWIITEGWFTKYGIHISQTDKWNYQEEIKKLLDDLNIRYSVRNRGKRNHNETSFKSNYDEYDFYIYAENSKNIKEKLNYKKEINKNWVKDWDKESLKVLFWTLMRGDGSGSVNGGHKNKLEFKGSDHDLECVLEICLKIGYKANINYKAHAIYITQYQDSKFHLLTKGNKNTIWDKEMYIGKVWCVTVENDTIFVKRNGKTFVTGNSAYPSHQRYLPNWSNGDFIRVREDEITEDDKYGWVLVAFNYPLIPLASDVYNIWTEIHENDEIEVRAKYNKKFYPTGDRAQVITLTEYRFLKKHGYLLDNRCEGYVWRHNPSKPQYPDPFTWIDRIYQMKKDAKVKYGKDSYQYSLVKIPLNSSYGVTAQTVGYAVYYNPFYASLITGNTRMQICEMLEEIGYDNVISIATDGILLEGDITLDDKYTQGGLGSWDVEHWDKGALVLANGIYYLEREHENPQKQVKQAIRGLLTHTGGSLKEDIIKHKNESEYVPTWKYRPITMYQAMKWTRYRGRDWINRFVRTGRKLSCNTDKNKRWDEINIFNDLLENNFTGERFTVEEVENGAGKE